MAEANLIVTFDPTKEESAKKEITEKLAAIKEKGKILKIKEGLAEISEFFLFPLSPLAFL